MYFFLNIWLFYVVHLKFRYIPLKNFRNILDLKNQDVIFILHFYIKISLILLLEYSKFITDL